MYKSISILLVLMVISTITALSQSARFNISTFETIKLNSKGYYIGENSQKSYVNGHFTYRINYDTAWNSWAGIAVSNHKDTVTKDYTNEFSPITGKAFNGSKNYGVCYNSGTIISEKTSKLFGFYITNTVYTYNTIKNGSAFSKKFGGTSGNDTDWYRIKFVNYMGSKRSDSLYFYLADYRFSDNSKDYIVKNWQWVDLSVFNKLTDSLKITFESTDNGTWGMNTPAYMVFDDFNFSNYQNPFIEFNKQEFYEKGIVWNGESDTSGGFDIGGFYFENNYDTKWKTWSGWAVSRESDTSKTGIDAQYSSITGLVNNAISYGRSVIRLNNNFTNLPSLTLSFSNNTYTYKAMKYGDAFSKKFGGITGNDSDFLLINVFCYNNEKLLDTFKVYLANFTQEPRYIQKNSKFLLLKNIRNYTRIEFELESSDNGTWGMNTPAYFCLNSLYWVNEIKNLSLIKTTVYPNPASDYILTELSNFESYQITDISGKEYTCKTSRDTNRIDIKNLPQGIFIIKYSDGNTQYYSRFVK